MRFIPIILAVSLIRVMPVYAATYFVDYDHGADTNTGITRDTPWKHAPGDSSATGEVKKLKLQPGDVVKFKGGVVYRGSIAITSSGADAKPITYDGNRAGDWGKGKAVIEGSVPLTGLTVCTSAAEARGNLNFKKIYQTTVPKGANWNTLNLCQKLKALTVAQDPNPESAIYQENPKYYYKTEPHIPQTISSIKVRALNNMGENWQRPLIAMFDGTRHSAVIEEINGGGEVELKLTEAVTVTAFSVTPQPRYTNPKEMAFLVKGKEILRINPKASEKKAVAQRFKLPAPVTFTELVVKFISAHPSSDGTTRSWGAVQAIGAYDQNGTNVLLATRKSVLRNDKVFAQKNPDYYDNAMLALYAKPAAVYYKRILSYDPAQHQISFQTLGHTQKPYARGGAFSIVNSVRHIDKPGEYALILNPEKDGSHKLFVWPLGDTPEGLTRAQHGIGITVHGSYVTVQGFWVRKQGWKGSGGIDGRGKGTDLTIRDCRVSGLRGHGTGIHTTLIDHVLVENCEVVDNAGHTKGIVLRNAKNIVVRGCTLRRNSSTALDFYTVTNGVVQDCLVDDNRGMHANGLTFYVNCRNILVERNHVLNGNVGLTVQAGDGMIIRNNIIEGGKGGAFAIGLWSGGPYNNILITNNLLRHHGGRDSSNAAIYGGNSSARGYAIVNNIIDGLSGNVLSKADIHHNIFTKLGPTLPKARLGNNLLVEDPKAIFVDPEKGDWRLKPGSPAIGAGLTITSINRFDRIGVERKADGTIDIGPYEFTPEGAAAKKNLLLADPRTFKFTLDNYRIAPPPEYKPTYKARFKKREGAEEIILKGVDRSAEGGGKVNLRTTRGGYVSGWDKPGHWLEWTVEVKEAGACEVAIEHASEMPSVRQVLLNGKPVPDLDKVAFPATGAWRTFQITGLKKPLMLQTGKNLIRFMNVAGSLNFKTLRFVPVIAP